MIKLDKNFSIKRNDQYNFTLVKEVEGEINPKTGKPSVSRDHWYYGTIKQALKRYIDVSITEEHDSVEKVFKKLEEIEKVIDNLKI